MSVFIDEIWAGHFLVQCEFVVTTLCPAAGVYLTVNIHVVREAHQHGILVLGNI